MKRVLRFIAIGLLGLGGSCDTPPAVLGTGAATSLVCDPLWTFDDSQQGWTSAPLVQSAANPWQHGVATGPGCQNGTRCFAVPLASGYPGCAAAVLLSPDINIVGCGQTATLSFWHWRDFNNPGDPASPPDGGYVQISFNAGNTWLDLESPGQDPYNGELSADPKKCSDEAIIRAYIGHRGWGSRNRDGWANPVFALPRLAVTQPFRLRFVFGSSGYIDARGWIVDTVLVSTDP